MHYTVGQAAKATGKSKPTITRALHKGLISYTKSELDGSYRIDPAELHRVFPMLPHDGNVPLAVTHHDTADDTRNDTAALQVEARLLREMLEARNAALEDLKEDRDRWRAQAERLALAAPVPVPRPAGDRPVPWWRRWLGD